MTDESHSHFELATQGHFFQDNINVHERQRVSHDAVLTSVFNINDESNVRLEVLTAALLKIQVFWNAMFCCSLLGVLDHEQDDRVTLQNIAAIYQSTCLNIPEDQNL